MQVPKTRRMPMVSDDARPGDIMEAIREKSRQIAAQQAKADAGQLTTYGGAIALQRLRMDRAALKGMLPPLQIVEDQ